MLDVQSKAKAKLWDSLYCDWTLKIFQSLQCNDYLFWVHLHFFISTKSKLVWFFSFPINTKELASTCSAFCSQGSLHELYNIGSSGKSHHRRGGRLVVRAESVSVLSDIFNGMKYISISSFLVDWNVDYFSVCTLYTQDFYSVLGVSKNASKAEIKSG